MKRIAIPIFDNNISEYFGECSYYEIYEINKKVLNKKRVEMPVGITVTDLPAWFEDLGVTDVIAYKVNKQIISLFASKKVNLFVGIARQDPEKLIDDYLNGKLESDKNIIAELTRGEN